LAEDRIFCFILFTLKDSNYTLKYIPDAIARTDAPELYGEFMLQRRRWINGSNFAMYYNLGIYSKVCQTKHKLFFRQIFIFFLFLYYFLTAILSYFTLGTFFFGYYMISMKMWDNKVQLKDETYISKQGIGSSLIMALYLFIILFSVVTSLIIKPIRNVQENGKVVYNRTTIFKIITFLLGLYNTFAFIFAIYAIFKNSPLNNNSKNKTDVFETYHDYGGAIFLIAVGISSLIFPLLYEPSMIICWFKNFFQYLFLQPTYSVILSIFSVCNIDDVSWGNRDSTHHMTKDSFKFYKIRFLFFWLILNFIQGWGFSYIVIETKYDKSLINTYSCIIAILLLFKLVFAVSGKLKYLIYDKKIENLLMSPNEKKRLEELNNKDIQEKKNKNEVNDLDNKNIKQEENTRNKNIKEDLKKFVQIPSYEKDEKNNIDSESKKIPAGRLNEIVEEGVKKRKNDLKNDINELDNFEEMEDIQINDNDMNNNNNLDRRNNYINKYSEDKNINPIRRKNRNSGVMEEEEEKN